jgi:acetyltransferase-like isoleucine patch superfamily enzyme
MILNLLHFLLLLVSRLIGALLLVIIKLDSRISVGVNTRLRGWYGFELDTGSQVVIGSNVLLNASSTGYHFGFRAAAKIRAGSQAVVIISDNVRMHGASIQSLDRVEIGRGTVIAAGVIIMDNNGHALALEAPERRLIETDVPRKVTIGDYVWIGANAIILPGSIIEAGAIIPAGSIVKGKVASRTIFSIKSEPYNSSEI